ncbi:uncharacterized protein LOC117645866 [Thrips palmi]|uniref:Uncharacterized protein LOC117645866 n=1 Tax=Thrips palmi TaxID=161013 RepID=A0A6P8ZNG1_THRPL|nr:uncharacterized protein LOC117645866 [Thrips palmi]
MSALWVLLLAVSLDLSGGDRINSFAGPFRVVPDHLEDCPPEMQPLKEYYKLRYSAARDRKVQEIWYYTGNLTTHFRFDDSLTGHANVASWSSRGGWIDNAHVLTSPRICSTIRERLPEAWRTFVVAMFNNPLQGCPFPADTYHIVNMSTNMNFNYPPTFFYGKWRSTVKLMRTSSNEVLGCIRAFFSTLPKLRHR